MRLALLSDIHANLRAFRACLAHARAQGADHFALLGDLVGYGAEPAEVVDLAMQMQQDGAVVLQGNHDLLAARGGPSVAGGTADAGAARSGGKPTAPANEAEAGAAWTHGRLSTHQRNFLEGLPLTHRLDGCLLVHATADAPADWHYATSAPRALRSLEAARQLGAHCVFGGHVHEQRLWFAGRRGDLMPFEPTPGVAVPLAAYRPWLATIGSVGQPRDGDTSAGYALYETPGSTSGWPSEAGIDGHSGAGTGPTLATPRLTFLRVPYDHEAAADAVRASGLPTRLADRLMEGR